jgi:hypothetical protein
MGTQRVTRTPRTQAVQTSPHGEEVVTVVALNLPRDGGENTSDGGLPKRWLDAHHEILKPLNADVILTQEATFSHLQDERRMRVAGKLPGMKGFLSPNGVGRNPTALFVPPETFPVCERVTYNPMFWRTPPTPAVAVIASKARQSKSSTPKRTPRSNAFEWSVPPSEPESRRPSRGRSPNGLRLRASPRQTR